MEGRRMNQVPLFSSARELGNLIVTSNLIDSALTKILELQRDQTALLSPVPYKVYPSPKCTIVAFVPSPDCTQNPLPGQGDLVPSSRFDFLCTEEYKSVSINSAALTPFISPDDHLSGLKTQLTKIEGQLIITGHSLGGSVASLFTLCLLDGNILKPECRPFCITFGSPLIGDFGLQHSMWNSFFLHVVSNQDPVPGLFLPSGRSPPTSPHSQNTGYKPFGTYLLCSELGCACFENPDLILELLKVISSEVAGGLQDVDYGVILRNLKERAICKGLPQVGESFANPFAAGIIMELETIGFNETKLLQHNIDIETVISAMEAEARNLTQKNKAFDAKILNYKKKDMAELEWYKKASKYTNNGYYDCFKNWCSENQDNERLRERRKAEDMQIKRDSKRENHIVVLSESLKVYWEDMVAQVQRKPQKEGATFRTRWLYSGTVYRRMVEPLDIAAFYVEGGTDYINTGRSLHYKLLQQWYEEDEKPPSMDKLDSKKQKVSGILTEDSCFWAHVEEAILSCELLKSENCTLVQEKSSWDNLVKFEEYVMEQIDNYAVSPEIFLEKSSFMKWWGLYEGYIDTRSNSHSHGDGHPSNTDTPLVVWGAGVKHPRPMSESNHSDCGFRFVDEHMHDTPTPIEWGLNDLERVDVNQADIAPLMSTLLGSPCPVNSVGNLPLGYINMTEADEVEAVLANTKQVLNQFLRKSKIKQSNSLNFKPLKPLAHYSSVLDQIEDLISVKDYDAAMRVAQNLKSLALEGLHYFQTYDWLMLMTVVTLGYIGWMVYLVLHVLQNYTSLPENMFRKEQAVHLRNYTGKVYLCGYLLIGVLCLLLFLEHSPPLYHAYTAMTVFLWTQIFSEYWFLKGLWRHLRRSKYDYIIKLLATCAVSIFILEFLANSFTERKLYTWCFLVVGVVASVFLFKSIPWRSGIPIFVWVACWFLSVFTLMPAEIPDNNQLVIASGIMIIMIGIAARMLDMHTERNKYWLCILSHDRQKHRFPMLFHLQALLVGLSSLMVSLSTSHRTQKQELLPVHQLINWSIAGFSMVLPLFSASGLLSRLTSIFLGFAPTFLLLSIGYEAVFYGALALVLMAWMLFENTLLYLSKVKMSSASMKNMEGKVILDNDDRCFQLFDVRIPLIFMVLFNVAFFGTGNFASIASFEISSVYRFITIFSPFLMAALLIFKLFIPFMLVICLFSAITKLIQIPRLGCYFLVILFSDVMTIHFFFLVRNTGSWMEIGNSISHFGIVSAQVVFVLLLFALTNIYTRHSDQICSTIL